MKNYSGNIEFFSRKLAGELTQEELQDFSAWLSDSLENQEEFSGFETVWNDVDCIKDKTPIDVDAAWERFTQEVQGTQQKSFSFRPLMAIAAVVTIALMSWFGYQLLFKKSIDSIIVTTAMSNQKNIVLPDKSEVALNQNTKVTYPSQFGNERRIQLSGEAFFDVTKNSEKPFIIEVNSVCVQVVGTSFLVSENKDKSVTVVVKTGKVAVYTKGSTDTVFVTPGERVDVSQSQVAKSINSEKNYISWKTKVFEFHDQELQTVIQQINSSYYSQIQIADKELQHCRVSVSFKDKTIEQIIEILQMTLDITVEKQDGIILLRGKGC